MASVLSVVQGGVSAASGSFSVTVPTGCDKMVVLATGSHWAPITTLDWGATDLFPNRIVAADANYWASAFELDNPPEETRDLSWTNGGATHTDIMVVFLADVGAVRASNGATGAASAAIAAALTGLTPGDFILTPALQVGTDLAVPADWDELGVLSDRGTVRRRWASLVADGATEAMEWDDSAANTWATVAVAFEDTTPRDEIGYSTIGSGTGTVETSYAIAATAPEDGTLYSASLHIGMAGSGSDRIRLAVYEGGASDEDPTGATLLEDFGVLPVNTVGWHTLLSSSSAAFTSGQRLWFAWKATGAFGAAGRYSRESSAAGDWLNDAASGVVASADETDAWDATLGVTSTSTFIWPSAAINYTPASGGGPDPETLTVADAAHSHALDSVTLTQGHVLTVEDLSHGHGLEDLSLTQANVVSVEDMLNAHTLEATAPTQANNLVVDALLHAHSMDAPELVQGYVLAPEEMAHSHTLQGVILASGLVLGVEGAVHAHLLDTPDLIQAGLLQVQGLQHEHTLESPAVTFAAVLSVDGLLHAHTVESVEVSTATLLAIQGLLHSNTLETPELTQANILSVLDLLHAHELAAIVLRPEGWAPIEFVSLEFGFTLRVDKQLAYVLGIERDAVVVQRITRTFGF